MGKTNYGTWRTSSGSRSYHEQSPIRPCLDPCVDDHASSELLESIAAGPVLEQRDLLTIPTTTTTTNTSSSSYQHASSSARRLPPLRYSHVLLSFHSINSEEDEKQDDNNQYQVSSTTTKSTSTPLSQSTSLTSAAAAQWIGTVLEWYNFALMGYLSDVLGMVCFPPAQTNPHAALMESLLVFGSAFAMRPIGGLWIGYLGDTYGRAYALQVSFVTMAVPTILVAFLPSYATIGPGSYVLLLVLRLCQGVSAGGQLMSSLVCAVEGHDHRTWGYLGSWTMASANFGTFACVAVNYGLRQLLDPEPLQAYGWRWAFFVGGVGMAACAAMLPHGSGREQEEGHHDKRPSMERNNNNHDMQKHKQANPLRLAFAPDNVQSLLAACMIPMLWSGGFWLTFVWMAVYMVDLLPVSNECGMATSAAALFLTVCCLFPLAGKASDAWGRRRVMTVGAMALGGLSPMLVVVVGRSHHDWMLPFICQSIMGIGLSLWGAPMMAWMVESFSPEARLTSVEIGYNIGQALVGGTTPAAATFLVDRFGPAAPGCWLTGLAAIALSGLWCVAPPVPQVEGTNGRGCDIIENGTSQEGSSLLNGTGIPVAMMATYESNSTNDVDGCNAASTVHT